LDETSQPLELLLTVARDNGAGTLGAQIEEQLRGAIRDGTVRAGARVPSTRDLARQLGVSRRVVVDAYAQLAAEGYLTMRQGARPHVADGAAALAEPDPDEALPATRPPRFDFRPSVPDVSTFPRAAWLRSLREAVTTMLDTDLAYGDANGVDALRIALAEYLGRVRGVSGGPAPARAYIEELLPDVLEGRIEPGRVFDRTGSLDDVPEGYRAMNERESIKFLIEV